MPARSRKMEVSSAGAEVWTVSQLTRRVKNLLESEIGSIWVSGEISNWRVSPAGHAYFTLKDEHSQLAAVMFRGKIARLRFEPETGLEVVVQGLVSVYEQRGAYQIICDDMQPKGVGALQLAYEKLKAKLDAEGLFDDAHKKPLPLLPKRIGVVTSPTGAAVRDILNVLHRRFAPLHVVLYPARVQGDEAATEIVEGIRALDAFGVDVMIVGRGGGSLEDLWAFNEEPVVRAIFEAKTPIISAVGHEIDFTLSDFAADFRAPTPSAAAEIVVQEQQALQQRVVQLRQRARVVLEVRLERSREGLARLQSSRVLRQPEDLVRQRRQRADDLRMEVERSARLAVERERNRVQRMSQQLLMLSPERQLARSRERVRAALLALKRGGDATTGRRRNRLRPVAAGLNALSPLAILSRGYSLAFAMPSGKLVLDAGTLSEGSELKLRFAAGEATTRVESIQPTPEEPGKERKSS